MRWFSLTAFVLALVCGCDGDGESTDVLDDARPTDVSTDQETADQSAPDTQADLNQSDAAEGDQRADLSDDVEEIESCERLFGSPTEFTGLPEGHCASTCSCDGDEWAMPIYSEADLEVLEAAVLTNPPELTGTNPYERADEYNYDPTKACGIQVMGTGPEYELVTFDSLEALEEAGATLTHYGACGACSSLGDLAVYLRNTDLTQPVRDCGVRGFQEGEEVQRKCIEDIGFSPACAEIWFYNTINTRDVCIEVCLTLLSAPYHDKNGELNACILCDEEKSGPVFKAVSGRTRRNSGLASALCRPCDTVQRVEHNDYPFP